MTKAEFIKRLEDQFQGVIESVKRRTAAEIEDSRARIDAQRFADWLRSEVDKANAEPALKAFDVVLRASHSTPHDAADSLAALIEMDTAPDDWQTKWDSAAPLISNFRPEKSDGWKYRRAFADYMAAVKAEARAGIFAEAISENTPGTRNPKQKPKAEPPEHYAKPRATAEREIEEKFKHHEKERKAKKEPDSGAHHFAR